LLTAIASTIVDADVGDVSGADTVAVAAADSASGQSEAFAGRAGARGPHRGHAVFLALHLAQ